MEELIEVFEKDLNNFINSKQSLYLLNLNRYKKRFKHLSQEKLKEIITTELSSSQIEYLESPLIIVNPSVEISVEEITDFLNKLLLQKQLQFKIQLGAFVISSLLIFGILFLWTINS